MVFQVVPTDMKAASASLADASSAARTAHGADALATLGAALPGSSIADYAPQLAGLWEEGVTGWCDRLDELGSSLDQTTQESTSADENAGSWFSRLLGGS